MRQSELPHLPKQYPILDGSRQALAPPTIEHLATHKPVEGAVLTEESQLADLSDYYSNIGLSDEGIAVAERARRESPTRRSEGWNGSVTGNTFNRYTGHTVPFDARTTEYVRATELNFARDVVEFHVQPPKRKIRYSKNGIKDVTFWRTHDFIVFRDNAVSYEECGDDKKFTKEQEQKGSDLYRRDADGIWTAPAFERDAADIGFGFKVFCPDQFDVTFARNASYIRDYMWRQIPGCYQDEVKHLKDYLKSQKVVVLDQLQSKFSKDAILFAIAQRKAFIDWYTTLLCAPEATAVYASEVHEAIDEKRRQSASPTFSVTQLAAGQRLNWSGKIWQIIDLDQELVRLIGPTFDLVTIKLSEIVNAIRSGEIIANNPSSAVDDAATGLLKTLSAETLEDALSRYQKLMRFKAGKRDDLCDRTARDWAVKAAIGESLYGNPVLGLVHKNALKGNRNEKADELAISLALEVIDGKYEATHKPSEHRTYAQYVSVCERKFVSPISKTTYNTYVNNRDKVEQTRKRDGSKAAYQKSGPSTDTDVATPHNGDRAWEIAHIDHTLVDLATISKLDNTPLGKMWLTLMMDAFSRKILAMWLSAFAPSAISLLMVIRDCVRRWGRLPGAMVVDQGSEFKSVWFDVFLAKVDIDKMLRGKSAPRAGSLMERLFGIADTTFTHQLFGNTEHNRLFRMQSKSHDPSIHAIWTPDALAEELEHWAFNFYPTIENTGIGEAPKNRFDRSIADSGLREFKIIPFDKNFLFSTMPETPHGLTRKVCKGTVRIDHVDYRGRHASINPFNGEVGRTRWEPYNPALSYIHVGNQWRELTCTNDMLRELMERQVKCSHFELSARLSRSKRKYRDVDPELIKLVERLDAKQTQLIAEKSERAQESQIEAENGPNEPFQLPVVSPIQITERRKYK